MTLLHDHRTDVSGPLVRRLAAVLCVVALGVGCGDDPPADPQAQPTPGGTAFAEGDFGDIPVFRGATPIGAVSRTGGNVSGSWEVATATPETVIAFYRETLPSMGWSEVEPVREVNDSVWRGDWLRDGRRLQVITSPLKPEGRDVSQDVAEAQLNLVLLDDASAPSSVAPATVPPTSAP